MVGHRLGEFSPTRKFTRHGGKIQKEMELAAKQKVQDANKANKERFDRHGCTPLMQAVDHRQFSIVEYLLEKGCLTDPPMERDVWHRGTALHRAVCIRKGAEYVELLMRYGANIDALTFNGDKAIDIAIRFRRHAVVDAIRAEEIRRRDRGFKRDRSTIPGTEEYEAAKQPRVEHEAVCTGKLY